MKRLLVQLRLGLLRAQEERLRQHIGQAYFRGDWAGQARARQMRVRESIRILEASLRRK